MQATGRSIIVKLEGAPGNGKTTLLTKIMIALKDEYEFVIDENLSEHTIVAVRKEIPDA